MCQVEHGPDSWGTDLNGDRPIHYIAKGETRVHLWAMKAVLAEAPHLVDSPDLGGDTPLTLAIYHELNEMAWLLIENKACLVLKNKKNMSAL